VHNGIEYGDMQTVAEIYDLLHRARAGYFIRIAVADALPFPRRLHLLPE
jgi:6-phosphogluconate dehydrogenase (decarboxylating)